MASNYYSHNGPAPCVVFKCENRLRCETEQLACQSFKHYVGSALMQEPTEPSEEFFKMVFDERQDDYKGYMMEKQINVTFTKTDAEKQSATGVVFSPNKLDTQGDYMTTPGVEVAHEGFMKSGRTQAIDTNHNGIPVNAFISESYLAKENSGFPLGSWVASVKIEDPDVWQMVKSGELTGFSMEGTGSRSPSKLNGKVANLLSNVEVFAISLVKRGANKQKFAVVKMKTGVTAFDEATAQLEKAVANFAKQQGKDKPVVTQEQRKEIDKRRVRVEYLKRVIKYANDQIFGMYENPMPGWQRREQRLEDKIQEAEAEIFALGIEDKTFEKHSAFGGMSVVVPITDPNLGHSTLGVTGNYADVLKDDKPVDCNTMGTSDDGRYNDLASVSLGSIK